MLRPYALALSSMPGALPRQPTNADLQLHDGPLADDTVVLMGEAVTVVSDNASDDEPQTAGWKQWWASDAHKQREQERVDRVVKITNKVHEMIVEALPTSYPEFEQVMHYVDWTLLNQPGGLMDIDYHVIEKVMEEFVVRKVAMTREHN